MKMNKHPDLKFGPGISTGFTPTGIAAFTDLRPAAVVRELIQNALDAAREANERLAFVRFRLTRKNTSKIPGIHSYRKALKSAIETHKEMGGGELPSQAQLVVNTIKDALAEETQDILSVLDNGIGLNEHRMNALLSDGISAKGSNATGTYGNGHSVAIPASNLRYILYGGVTDNGRRIGAGHAVLASHTGNLKDDHPRAGDGFFVFKFWNGKDGKLYDYVTAQAIPELIAGDLKDIRETDRHGTAVVIPAFNHFREKRPLWDMVSRAVACNFFQAIDEERLRVQVEDLRPGKTPTPQVLDRATLRGVLEAHREDKRSGAFLSGQRACEAHEVLRSGESHTVQTKMGVIRVKLLHRVSGNTRVDLCRNGMWITDDKNIPGFYYKFQDRIPFHAVLLLDSDKGKELHRLVRDSEGPLHDSMSVKYLPRNDKANLRTALDEIRMWLQSNTSEISQESYSPDDFLTIDFGDEGEAQGGAARHAVWGTPTAVGQTEHRSSHVSPHPAPDPGQNPDPAPNPNPDPKPHPSRSRPRSRLRSRPELKAFFQAVSVPTGNNRRRIRIECQEACENAEFRLLVDENVDATCDRLRNDEITPVILSGVTVDGQQTGNASLVKQGGYVVGVRLGNLSPGASVQVEANYRLSEDFDSSSKAKPSLRVEIFKAQIETRGGEAK